MENLPNSIDRTNVQTVPASFATVPVEPILAPSPPVVTPPTKLNWWLIALSVVIGGLIISVILLYLQNQQLRSQLGGDAVLPLSPSPSAMTTYDQCAQATGSVIQESYPAVCVAASGERFSQEIPLEQGLEPELVPVSTSTLDEVSKACIAIQNSSKYWDPKYQECNGTGEDQTPLKNFCTEYGGTFVPNGSSCRHAQAEGIPCGPEAAFYCSFATRSEASEKEAVSTP